MRIMVVVDCLPDAGGVFSYMQSLCKLIKNAESSHAFLFFATSKDTAEKLQNHNIETVKYSYDAKKTSRFSNMKNWISMFLGGTEINSIPRKSVIDSIVQEHGIDLVYFLGHSPLALELTKAPFIFTVWDFCHRDWPEFPEVNTDRIFESRENSFRNSLNRAIAVVVDSDALAEKTIKYYGVNKERIIKIPFLIDKYREINLIDVVEKYKLEKPFIFYPAQFWPHKNHYYILEGLALLKNEYDLIINAVFTGTDKGNLSYIMMMAQKMGVASQIRYLGFIPQEEIYSIYKETVALIMPTYFGPTNIPPLEAFSVDCTLLYSDLSEFRQEYDGTAFFMDLDDPRSMAESLISVLNKDPIVEQQKEAGRKLLDKHNAKNAWIVLEKTFISFEKLLKRWK